MRGSPLLPAFLLSSNPLCQTLAFKSERVFSEVVSPFVRRNLCLRRTIRLLLRSWDQMGLDMREVEAGMYRIY